MRIIFDKDYLSELYSLGRCNDEKHRFQPAIIKKYIRVIDTLIAANDIEDLFRIKSLNYERLLGDKKGIESVRVNDQYRIEMTTKKVKEEIELTICNILDLTNHHD